MVRIRPFLDTDHGFEILRRRESDSSSEGFERDSGAGSGVDLKSRNSGFQLFHLRENYISTKCSWPTRFFVFLVFPSPSRPECRHWSEVFRACWTISRFLSPCGRRSFLLG